MRDTIVASVIMGSIRAMVKIAMAAWLAVVWNVVVCNISASPKITIAQALVVVVILSLMQLAGGKRRPRER